MANPPLTRPGVEVEQKFVSASPTILTPALPACIVGRGMYLVDVFNPDQTLNTSSQATGTYNNTSTVVAVANFPDPRNILANSNLDNSSIRVWVASAGTNPDIVEVLATRAFLAPGAPPKTADVVDDNPGSGISNTVSLSETTAEFTDTNFKAGDIIIIEGQEFTIVSASDNAGAVEIVVDGDLIVGQTGLTYFAIATTDLTRALTGSAAPGSLTPFLVVNPTTGDVTIAAGFRRRIDGAVATNIADNIFIQYEALRRDLSANPLTGNPSLLTIRDQNDLDVQLGPLSTRNPLSVGTLFALINSPTVAVNALGVDETTTAAPDGTLAGFNRALSFLEGKEIYGLVPLTQDAVVIQAFATHVTALSQPAKKRERITLVNQAQPSSEANKTRSSGSLANTIDRSPTELTGGFDPATDFNVRTENEIGTPLVSAAVVGATDLTKFGKLRDALIFLEIAGSSEKFPVRTIDGKDMEIVGEKITDESAAGLGIGVISPSGTPNTSTFTFTPAGNSAEDAGVRKGDKFVVTTTTGGGGDDNTGTFTVFSIAGNVITIEEALTGTDTSADVFVVNMVDLNFTVDATGLAVSAPGTPFVNQLWAVKTLGAALVLPGTSPAIPNRPAIASTIGEIAESFANRRVIFVQPDTFISSAVDGTEQSLPGYYLACAIAGMIGEQPPQQGFTNFPMAGVTSLVNSNDVFSDDDIAIAAGGGTYWVIQEAPGANVISQHQLTTDLSSIETRELSITKVVDFTAKFLRSGLRRFIGIFNITPEFLDQLNTITQGLLNNLEVQGALNGGDLNSLTASTSQPDTVLVDVTLDVPFPSNFIKITLQV